MIALHGHVFIDFVIHSLFGASITLVWWIALTDTQAWAYPEPHKTFSKTHFRVSILENIIQWYNLRISLWRGHLHIHQNCASIGINLMPAFRSAAKYSISLTVQHQDLFSSPQRANEMAKKWYYWPGFDEVTTFLQSECKLEQYWLGYRQLTPLPPYYFRKSGEIMRGTTLFRFLQSCHYGPSELLLRMYRPGHPDNCLFF